MMRRVVTVAAFLIATSASAFTEELPEAFRALIVEGNIESLTEYVRLHGDFSDKYSTVDGMGELGPAFHLATLPMVGLEMDESDDYLYRSDDIELRLIWDRNERVARFLFENGADPNGTLDPGFGPISYLGFLFLLDG